MREILLLYEAMCGIKVSEVKRYFIYLKAGAIFMIRGGLAFIFLTIVFIPSTNAQSSVLNSLNKHRISLSAAKISRTKQKKPVSQVKQKIKTDLQALSKDKAINKKDQAKKNPATSFKRSGKTLLAKQVSPAAVLAKYGRTREAGERAALFSLSPDKKESFRAKWSLPASVFAGKRQEGTDKREKGPDPVFAEYSFVSGAGEGNDVVQQGNVSQVFSPEQAAQLPEEEKQRLEDTITELGGPEKAREVVATMVEVYGQDTVDKIFAQYAGIEDDPGFQPVQEEGDDLTSFMYYIGRAGAEKYAENAELIKGMTLEGVDTSSWPETQPYVFNKYAYYSGTAGDVQGYMDTVESLRYIFTADINDFELSQAASMAYSEFGGTESLLDFIDSSAEAIGCEKEEIIHSFEGSISADIIFGIYDNINDFGMEKISGHLNDLSRFYGKELTLALFGDNCSREMGESSFYKLISSLEQSGGLDTIVAGLSQKYDTAEVKEAMLKMGIMSTARIAPEDLGIIVGNMITPDDRDLAVVVGCRYDSNGVFCEELKHVSSLIEAGYRVVYYEAGSDREVIDALKDSTDEGSNPASVIMICGHGQQDTIWMGERAGGEETTLDFGDIDNFQSVSNTLENNGTVILCSCATGKTEGEEKNMVNMFACVFPQAGAVWGPQRSTRMESIEFNGDQSIREVTYDDPGYNGAGANFHELPEPTDPTTSSLYMELLKL